MAQPLDTVARQLGITRQSVIKVFISEKLKDEELTLQPELNYCENGRQDLPPQVSPINL